MIIKPTYKKPELETHGLATVAGSYLRGHYGLVQRTPIWEVGH